MDPLLERDIREDLLDEGPTLKTHQTPEKHLDSAITCSLLDRLERFIDLAKAETPNFRNSGKCPVRANVLHNTLQRHPELTYSNLRRHLMSYSRCLDWCKKPPKRLTAELYPFLFENSGLIQTDCDDRFEHTNRLYQIEIASYMAHVNDLLKPIDARSFRRKLEMKIIDKHRLSTACGRAETWSKIVDHYRYSYGRTAHPKKRVFGTLKVVSGEGFLLIKHPAWDCWRLLTFEQAQMIQDALLARSNVEAALQFNQHNGTSALAGLVDRMLNWQSSVLTRYGNAGYELVKAPEAVFKTYLTTLTHGDILEYSSYERTIDKIKLKELKLAADTPMVDLLTELVADVHTVCDAAELFGLTKLSGHPTVYAEKSAATVISKIRAPKTCSAYHLKQVVRVAKHLILSGYIRQHSDWPPFVCPPQSHLELGRHYQNRVTTLNLGSYPLCEIDSIVFDKFIEFDYSEDYLKFIDDKAICPGATEMSKFWFGSVEVEPRRLLQKILAMTEFDTRALVERMRKGQFHDDELVVELTQKEREFKMSARCFAKLPFEVRTFFTLNEYNLKEHFMKPYIPHQTMTMSHADEKRRLYNMVKDAKNRQTCLVEGDYSSWNLQMCFESVQPIAEELNDIFGVEGVFTQLHQFFDRATCVITDKHTLPAGAKPDVPITQWPESDILWRHHNRGYEGLGQGMWSFVTIAMCIWCTIDLNVSYNIALQGDNVVFAFHFNDVTTETMAVQLRRLLAYLEVRSRWINHEVKPEECIDSLTVLTYSKEVYVEGANILYNLKFASRSFRRDDIDVPSLGKEIAAANASAMACADTLYMTPRALFWKFWLVVGILQYRASSEHHSREHTILHEVLRSRTLLDFTLLLPGSLGGLPMMPWTRFFMKGEVDDLSWDVPAYMSYGERLRLYASDLRHLLAGAYTPKHPDLTQLLLDPHSIPINRPKDMTRLIKEEVAAVLPGIARNTAIRSIISQQTVTAGHQLLETLARTRPFYPQIMADVYKLSPAGVKDAILGRFVMTRTLTKITNSSKFTAVIEQSNVLLLRGIRARVKNSLQRPLGRTAKTPYTVCTDLRHLWGPEVENSCVGVYTPFEYKLRHTSSASPRISASTRTSNPSDMLFTAGSYAPNFGTKTKSKATTHGFRIVTSASTVVDLKALTMIWSELGSDPTLARVLGSIAYARSPWSLETLSQVLPTQYGGSAAHRHESLDAKHFAVLGSKTVPTHLNLCSDSAGKLSGGDIDVPIAFQPFYLTLTNLYQTFCAADLDIGNTEISYLLTDDYEQLPEEAVKVTGPAPGIVWKSLIGNPLSHVTKLQMTEIPHHLPADLVPRQEVGSINPVNLVYSVLIQKYAHSAIRAMSRAITVQPVDIFDLKEFNHIPLSSLITGVAFYCQAVAVNAIADQSRSLDQHRLYEALVSVCRSLGGLIARLFVHPSNATCQFAKNLAIRLMPGEYGALNAADQLSGYFVMYCLNSLHARDAATKKCRLILYETNAKSFCSLTYRHALFMACVDNGSQEVSLSTRDKLSLLSASRSTLNTGSILFKIGQIKGYFKIIMAERESRGKYIYNTNLLLGYCRASPEVALRGLRVRPKDYRARLSMDNAPRFRSLSLPRVVYTHVFEEGALEPECDCSRGDLDRMRVKILNLAHRPRGVYASALSVWEQVLASYRRTIEGMTVISVGVGHGAISRAVLQLGCKNVIGIDLRKSFPLSAQREGVYKPPEVIDSGRSADFEWSWYVASHGGDIFKSVDWLAEASEDTILIIDVEQDAKETLKLLDSRARSKTIFVRISCCEHTLSYWIDTTQPSTVISLDARTSRLGSSYLLVYSSSIPPNRSGNSHRVNITEIPSYRCQLDKRNDLDALNVFNRWLRKYGYEIDTLAVSKLRALVPKVHRDHLNMEDLARMCEWGDMQDTLKQVIALIEDPASLMATTTENLAVRLAARFFSQSDTHRGILEELVS